MTDSDNDKLEYLLTDWGDRQCGRGLDACLSISQAARLVGEGPDDPSHAEHVRTCPTCARLVGRLEADDEAPSGRSPKINLWLAAAVAIAAAVVLAASVWLAAIATTRGPAEALQNALARSGEQIASLRERRDEQQSRIRVLEANLAATLQQGNETIAAMRAQLGQAQEAAQAARRQANEFAAALERFEQQLAVVRSGADRLGEALARRDRELETLRAVHTERTVALTRRIRELTSQIEQIRSAQAARAEADRALWRQLLPAGNESRIERETLASMQTVARKAALAELAADLALVAPDPAAARLLRRLEAVLLRLEMADPADPAERLWLSRLVSDDTLRVIDSRLSGDPAKLSEAERSFLSQVHVILLRGASAG